MPEVLKPGQHVRLLLAGKQTYSAEGVLTEVLPNSLRLRRPNAAEFAIPASALVSAEVMSGNPGAPTWTPGVLPQGMAHLLPPLERIFKTGAGAVPRHTDAYATDSAIATLEQFRDDLVSESSRRLTDAVIQILKLLEQCQRCPRYDEAKRLKERCDAQILAMVGLLESYEDSQRLRLVAADLCNRISTVLERHWLAYEKEMDPRPRFSSFFEAPVIAVNAVGETRIPFRVVLDDQFAPIRQVQVELDEVPGVRFLGTRPFLAELNTGETRTVEVAAVVDLELASSQSSALRFRAQLRYRRPDGEVKLTPKQTLEFRLHLPQAFEPIKNPFIAYSGGTAVSDQNMFFGRREMLAEIVEQLTTGALGQCFAIYGQKRTGKTSLLEQARVRIDHAPVIPIALSFGTIDRFDLTQSFVSEVLEQLRLPLLENLSQSDFSRLQGLWPTPSRISERPLESLRTALTAGRRLLSRYPGWAGLRFVLLADEFTYLYEVLRRPGVPDSEIAGVREFMRQWKALLEMQYFSALVVGQDTMPAFMQRFPNEFSSMNSRRLSYLTPEETAQLATEPILTPDGSSRYLGYAVQSVFAYTDGHPFFTQILCDRLVRLANSRKRGEFTESDVLEAAQSLISGSDPMEFHRFDCLLTADNTGLVTTSLSNTNDDLEPVEQYDDRGEGAFQLLYSIAQAAGEQNRFVDPRHVDIAGDDDPLIADLLAREVLTRRADGRVQVRVLLFAEYLRRM